MVSFRCCSTPFSNFNHRSAFHFNADRYLLGDREAIRIISFIQALLLNRRACYEKVCASG